ncbi:c-type cytochrome [Sulfuricystis multivorans]|uniref:c-type cytochrome n=1 Tax=Sulfuricystis multivorans TaxID=2211108 RepID=UPI0024E0016E|nr:c-type cytochrome [Sulfuricystis multivorans]
MFPFLPVRLSGAGFCSSGEDLILEKLSPATRQEIEMRCAPCHGVEKESANAIYPRLTAQYPNYLVTQLKDFGKRERTNDNAVMHSIASKLTELEMHAVAVYLGGQQ